MREIRTSGSVGAPPGNRRGYPTLVDVLVVVNGDGDVVGHRFAP